MKHTQYSRGQLVNCVVNMNLEVLVDAVLGKYRLQKYTSHMLRANNNVHMQLNILQLQLQ